MRIVYLSKFTFRLRWISDFWRRANRGSRRIYGGASGVVVDRQSPHKPAGRVSASSAPGIGQGSHSSAQDRRAYEIGFKTKQQIALNQIRAVCVAGIARGEALMNSAYGNDASLGLAITVLRMPCGAGIQSNTLVLKPRIGPPTVSSEARKLRRARSVSGQGGCPHSAGECSAEGQLTRPQHRSDVLPVCARTPLRHPRLMKAAKMRQKVGC